MSAHLLAAGCAYVDAHGHCKLGEPFSSPGTDVGGLAVLVFFIWVGSVLSGGKAGKK